MTLPVYPQRWPDWKPAHCRGTPGNSSGLPWKAAVLVAAHPPRPLVLKYLRHYQRLPAASSHDADKPILVIIGELPNLLGIPVTPGDVLHRISVLAPNINQIDPLTAAIPARASCRT